MATPPIEDSIEDKLLDILEPHYWNQGEEDGRAAAKRSVTYRQLLALIESEKASARLKENAWSRQQMIVAQALEAPNSGFGRMIKWAINLFNKRKLELLDQTKEPKEDI